MTNSDCDKYNFDERAKQNTADMGQDIQYN